MIEMSGRFHKPNALGIWPGQDATGKYAKRCIGFADENGWPRKDVCGYWAQVALRERAVAEDSAWHHVQAALHTLRQEATN